MAQGTTIYTPFYNETGWEFLDKYYEHRRFLTQKGDRYRYNLEQNKYQKKTGFEKMWHHVRNLEMTYSKFQSNMRRQGKVHENL